MKKLPELTIQPFEEFHTTLEYDFDEKRNDYFANRALKDQETDNSRVHVALTRDVQLAGFFTLSPYKKYFELHEKGKERTYYATLLGQLAVNKTFQGIGIGSYLVRKAIEFAMEAYLKVASVGLIAEADDPNLVDGFYGKLGFHLIDHDEKKKLWIMFYPFKEKE